MGIEHLQQLNVGGDDGDEVTSVPALQLGGAQPPQNPEHPVPDEGQQLKGDEMIARLLAPHTRANTPTQTNRAVSPIGAPKPSTDSAAYPPKW